MKNEAVKVSNKPIGICEAVMRGRGCLVTVWMNSAPATILCANGTIYNVYDDTGL